MSDKTEREGEKSPSTEKTVKEKIPYIKVKLARARHVNLDGIVVSQEKDDLIWIKSTDAYNEDGTLNDTFIEVDDTGQPLDTDKLEMDPIFYRMQTKIFQKGIPLEQKVTQKVDDERDNQIRSAIKRLGAGATRESVSQAISRQVSSEDMERLSA